ncbi:unnamed protein product [Aphanomyces euteiches]|uniref:Tetratricopeptide SHNi-TPR domain-containing protein n=1 Tax=Aphanomyces euteiches TaxID=100861 RepID=A0A6G0XPR3_9STRA|nr:hypothetical protein Ae201684_002578 [Aphanomyces euteiches]KAH9092924.1 hypothetical protein Ae201684P_008590 [Aphanomyces euteiches]KAH9146341.1 hypothetical protein AeRB84_009819 [Aphanomyces euteiches]
MDGLEETLKDPRFTRGVTLLKEKRYEEAVAHFEDLLRTMVETENNGDTLRVAPVYYEYGNALLSYAEATRDVFGGNEPTKAEDGEEEEENDLEVAWEMLEVARVLLSKHEGEDPRIDKELARVYMRLGDLSMESDLFPQARVDYEKSLVLQQKHLIPFEMDTTAFADIYCCLAITCIYESSKQTPVAEDDAAVAAEEETKVEEAPKMTQAEMELAGLKYYVQAGQVMIDNIYRQSEFCSEIVQEFVKTHIPLPLSKAPKPPVSKGKGKAKAESAEDMVLDYHGEYDQMRKHFLAKVTAGREDKEPNSTDDTRLLDDQEKKILEYLEIYTEVKEKVDGLRESYTTTHAAPPAGAPVTTIGFGQPPAPEKPATTTTAEATTEATPAPAANAVNVLPVTKKRKITPTTAE